MSTKPPRKFFEPLAIGAPAPFRELPVVLERMIHFFPPHLDKLRARIPEMIPQVDVLLGNLEDAIPSDAKEQARRGFIEVAAANEFGSTGLWTRVNCLNSPWFLDDVGEIVGTVGDKLDVIMLPKVEGPWDIHFLDQLLAQLEARHAVKKPILIHALLETALGVANVEAIAAASPRMHGLSLGPADLAASRGMKTTRVGGGHPSYGVLEDARADGGPRQLFQQDLWHYTVAKMVDACQSAGIKAFYGPFGDFSDDAACEAQFRNAFLLGCVGAWSLHPQADRHRQEGVQPGGRRSAVRQTHPRSDAGRQRRGDDRRQDAGRCHLEAGQGDGRPGQTGRPARPGDGGGVWVVVSRKSLGRRALASAGV